MAARPSRGDPVPTPRVAHAPHSVLMRPLSVLLVALAALAPASAQQGTLGSVRAGLSSPTAASLGEFGAVPVGLATGTPSVTIPLYEARGSDGLSLPVTLRYHGSAVRVDEVPGWAGLGWALDAGGAITRSIRGLRDEHPKGYYQPSGWSTASSMASNPTGAYLNDVRYGTQDSEPDEFFFSFAGQSGAFAFMPPPAGGTQYAVARTLTASTIDIQPTVSNHEITGWTVKAEDGTTYTFSEAERTTVNSGTLDGNQSYNSAWHLTKVVGPGGRDEITLTYETPTQDVVREVSTFYERRTYECYTSSYTSRGSDFTDARSTVSVRAKYLSAVTSDRERLRFIREGRTDDPNSFRLARIDVETTGGVFRKRFTLAHGYVNAARPASEQRLRLDSVQETAGTGSEVKPYTFTYEASRALPARDSRAVDHWGHFTGRTGTLSPLPYVWDPVMGFSLSGTDRSTSPAHVTAGMLTRVTYPTGGTTDFVWEPHDYLSVAAGTNGQPVTVTTFDNGQKTVSTDGLGSSLSVPGGIPGGVSQSLSSGFTGPGLQGCPFTVNAASAVTVPSTGELRIPVTITFTVTSSGFGFAAPVDGPEAAAPEAAAPEAASPDAPLGVELEANLGAPSAASYGPCQTSTTPEFNYPTVSIKSQFGRGNNVVSQGSQTSTTFTALLPAQTATYYITVEGANSKTVSASVTWRDVVSLSDAVAQGLVPYHRAVGGGVRIARTTTTDPVSGVAQVTRYEYRDRNDDSRSSGVLVAAPVYAFRATSISGNCEMLSHASRARSDLGSTQGAPVSYKTVRVLSGAAGTPVGSTWHTFRTANDAPDILATTAPPGFRMLPPRTSRSWRRGQETAAEAFNAAGQPVSSTTTTWSFTSADDPDANELHARATAVFVWPLARWTLGATTHEFSAWGSYYPTVGWAGPSRVATTTH